jgi:hypothetical protein
MEINGVLLYYNQLTINLQSTYNQLAIINDLRKNDVYGLQYDSFIMGFFLGGD